MSRARALVVDPLRARVRQVWRRRLVAGAADVTAASTHRSTLVVVPHPDDESLGCGAMIHRKAAAGTRVVLVVVADGSGSHPASAAMPTAELVATRAEEVRRAAAVLGVAPDDVHLLGLPDGTLHDRLDVVAARIDRLVREVDPQEVLVPSARDAHEDHRAAHLAARLAPAVWTGSRFVAEYPVWFWRDGPWTPSTGDPSVGQRARHLVSAPLTTGAQLRAVVVATGDHVVAKRRAIAEHRTQTVNVTGEPDWATFPPGFVEDFCGPVELLFELAPTDGHAPDDLAAASGVLTRDDLATDVPLGAVPGSRTADGIVRGGVDPQGVIGIDHGAGRIRPLPRPGWGRAVVSWGPYPAEPGLVLVAHVLNGHNASQTYHIRLPWRMRLRRLVADVVKRRFRFHVLRENLAIGWYPGPRGGAPATGAGFVMRSAQTTGGDLQVVRGGAATDVVEGVQNLPITYVVAVRPGGVAHYAGSLPGAPGFGEAPALRPLGIDPTPLSGPVHAVIQQAVLGEINFRVDTRVYGVRVQHVPALAHWCQAAHAAERQPGVGTHAERGGAWAEHAGARGRLHRWVDPGVPSGLLHVLVRPDDSPRGLLFRAGPRTAWSVEVAAGHARLVHHDDAGPRQVAEAVLPDDGGPRTALEVVDDGTRFVVHVDGHDLFGERFDAAGLDGTGVGVVLDGTDGVEDFEAHPLAVDLPALHADGPGLPSVRRGDRVVLDEAFDDHVGDLADSPGEWRRDLGDGRVVVAGAGRAGVDASVARPNPGRTLYTTPWRHGPAADVAIRVTPPGTRRGDGHAGRTGVVLWQDPDNYLVVSVWLDDSPGHDGSSVSSFLRSRGREEPYEAVWTNVGRQVDWGVTHDLRVSFDRGRWTAWLDDRPVLHRAVTDVDPQAPPFDLRRVGLAVNWEYGDDTGSVFHSFVARSLEDSP